MIKPIISFRGEDFINFWKMEDKKFTRIIPHFFPRRVIFKIGVFIFLGKAENPDKHSVVRKPDNLLEKEGKGMGEIATQ